MKDPKLKILVLIVVVVFCSCKSNISEMREMFVTPATEYKPMPFWHINGDMTSQKSEQQLSDAVLKSGFGGVTVLPIGSRINNTTGDVRPGMSPKYLSEAYFEQYKSILDIAQRLDVKVVLYDDIDFPSGTAGGKIKTQFPNHTRKRLDKSEQIFIGPGVYKTIIPEGKLMSAVAMDTNTLARIDITTSVVGNQLIWNAPEGEWRVMIFTSIKDNFHKQHLVVDPLDSVAVNYFIEFTYDEYAKRFGEYFGNTIQRTFFDDVGFFRAERTWTDSFNEKFTQINGFAPQIYYPALWYDIGSETQAARVAFFNTRAELLAEGFPKQVAEWNMKHELKSMGHPPGNYDPMPVDMNGDIFKFYRHTQIPLMDAIIGYGFGRDGHKLIGSVAEMYDRPIVGAEIYGAFKDSIIDRNMLYRVAMETIVRGANFIVPHGMWYTDKVFISPLISPYNAKIANELPSYSDYVGRMCYMMQGGRRVSDIALLYPISSLEAWFRFEAKENHRYGHWISPQTDYLRLSDILTKELRRDFTFVHPEYFSTDKYTIKGNNIHLNNAENYQDYKVMIIPGGNTISVTTLEKIKRYYDGGGCVIATTQLPHISAEMGKNEHICELINEIFNTTTGNINTNSSGGRSLFIESPTSVAIQRAMNSLNLTADVDFTQTPYNLGEHGALSYVHKVKNGHNIYLFANSSDSIVKTNICLRGKMKLEQWNPHDGATEKINDISYIKKDGVTYTQCILTMPAVSSLFWVEL